MEISFLGQGLASHNRPVGDILIESFNDGRYTHFYCFDAFVTEGGINRILEPYKNFSSKKGNKSIMFIGVDQKGTPKDALDLLLNLGYETYIYFNKNKTVIYHPKLYIFLGEDHARIILGSSNLTVTGLFQNLENSMLIEFDSDDEKGLKFLADIDNFYNDFFNRTNPNLKKLSREVIQRLVDAKVVPKEASQSHIHRKSGDSSSTNSSTDDLEDLFPDSWIPRRPTRTTVSTFPVSPPGGSVLPPSGPVSPSGGPVSSPPGPVSPSGGPVSSPSGPVSPSGGPVSSPPGPVSPSGGPVSSPPGPVSPSGGPVSSPPGTASPPSGGVTVWFESGSMTSGSRNILDLSVSSKHGGIGGIDLLNPTHIDPLNFTIRYHGVDYYGNVIMFPSKKTKKPNNSWRLSLRGKSTSGQKLTDFARPLVPKGPGQLANSILVFEEIGPNHYELTVEPLTRLSHYQSISSLVEQNKGAKGRYYGKL